MRRLGHLKTNSIGLSGGGDPRRVTPKAAALVHSIVYQIDIGKLTNAEIADLLLNRVWADIDITTEESAIVAEAIERLQGKVREG